MRQLAVYGKGGIGKSTVVSNVTAALSGAGRKVLQIGCDPKHDSNRAHLEGRLPRTVLDVLRRTGSTRDVAEHFEAGDFIRVGRDGVHCIESGGPEPGVGCAGRGIIVTIEALTELGIYDAGYDVIFYDVLGDVVCGGFAMPIRHGYAEEIYIVVSGEFLALYAANNICKGIQRYAATGKARLAGVIGNLRNVPNEKRIISEFSRSIGTGFVFLVPRSRTVTRAENARRTVIDHSPRSAQARVYRQLAGEMLENRSRVVPASLEEEDIERIVACED